MTANSKIKIMFSLLIFSGIVAVTAGNNMMSFAQTVNDDFTISDDSLDGLIPDDGTVDPAENYEGICGDSRVYLKKISTGDKICVTFHTSEKLIERGYGVYYYAIMGETWSNVCPIYAMTDENGCILDTIPLDGCRSVSKSDNYTCLNLNIKPKTILDCSEKYIYGYLLKVGAPISLSSYANLHCNLFDKTEYHGKICYDWWLGYKEISKNDLHTINESKFINKYCLNATEPDWKSWGYFERHGKITYGPILNFYNTLTNACSFELCKFTQYDGTVSHIQCEAQSSVTFFEYPQIIFNQTLNMYECVMPNSSQ